MTNPIPQDELIALAKEVGFEQIMNEAPTLMCSPEELEKFAQLIQQRGQVPDGWQLVPIEATADQINIGADELRQAIAMFNSGRSVQSAAIRVYKAMLGAAPKMHRITIPRIRADEGGCGAVEVCS